MSYSPVKWVSLDTVLRLPVHPAADKYRLLDEDAENDISLSSIAENMRLSGFNENYPLVVFKGALLDGRNRRAAANLAGLQEVPVREFYGTEAEARVVINQANDYRRHDDRSQRAWIAVDDWDQLAAEAKARSLKNLKYSGDSSTVQAWTLDENGEPIDCPSLDSRSEGPTSLGAVAAILAKRAGCGKSTMNAARALKLRYNAMKESVVAAEYEIGELEDELTRLTREVVYAEIDGRLQDVSDLQKRKGNLEGQLSLLRKSISEDQREVLHIDEQIASGASVSTLNNKLSEQPKVSRIPDKKKAVEAYDNLRRGARIIERSLKYLATCSGPDCFVDDAKEILDVLVGLGRETVRYEPPRRFEVSPPSNSQGSRMKRYYDDIQPGNGGIEPQQSDPQSVQAWTDFESGSDGAKDEEQPMRASTPVVVDDDWMFKKMYEMEPKPERREPI